MCLLAMVHQLFPSNGKINTVLASYTHSNVTLTLTELVCLLSNYLAPNPEDWTQYQSLQMDMTLSQFDQPSIPPTSTHKNSRCCNWMTEVSLPPQKSAMTSCLYYLQDIKNTKLGGLKWHTKFCVCKHDIIFPSLFFNHSVNLSMSQEGPALSLLLYSNKILLNVLKACMWQCHKLYIHNVCHRFVKL